MGAKIFNKWILVIVASIFSLIHIVDALAVDVSGPSVGGMAQSILVPIDAMTGLMYKICYVLGGAMIVGSGIQYKAHRDNPQQVPLNRPIFLLLVGLVLIALPLIAQLSAAASAASSS